MTISPRVLLVISCAWPLSLVADPGPQAPKIAVVDAQRAFQTSSEGKKATAEMQDKDRRLKADLDKLDDQLRGLLTRLNTQGMTLSAEGLAQLQSDITHKRTERQRAEEDGTRDYNLLANSRIQRIRAEMLEIVTALAKEKGLDLVLDSPAAVYFSPAIDLTEDVIKRYDASKAAKR